MDGRDPHAVLGVDQCASPEEIKRAFRARALVAHPDRGGRREDFEALVAAFERLTSRRHRWATSTPLERRAASARAANPFARAAAAVETTSTWAMYDSVRPRPPAAPEPRPSRFASLLEAELARLAA